MCLFWGVQNGIFAQAPPVAAPASNLTINETPSTGGKTLSLLNIPPILNPSDPDNASWNYFWMFEDGTFAKDNTNTLEREFPANQNVTVILRSRYHDGKEPPLRTVVTSGGGSGTKLASVLDEKAGREDSIHPNIRAARLGDSLFFAIVVRNKNETLRSGNVLLYFPENNFEYRGQVYTHAGVSKSGGEQSYPLGLPNLDGAIHTWRLTDMGRGEERSFFVCLVVKPTADTTAMHLIAIDMQWDGDTANDTPYPYLFPTSPPPPNEGTKFFKNDLTESPTVNFRGDSYTTIRINRARDPNGMLVFPAVIPPASSSPAHAFRYETHVENLGNATATDLGVGTYLKPALNYSTFDHVWPNNFYFPPGSPTLQVDAFTGGSDSIKWNFKNVNLQGVTPSGSKDNKANFMFAIRMKAGTVLNEGDKIPAYMVASMINGSNVVDDWEKSDPVYIHVVKPPRLRYGSVFGVKAYTFLEGKDSVGTRGLALTARVPLFRPRQYPTATGLLARSPRLFWQFEAGWGQGTELGGSRRYSTEYLQITPVQLRYIQPVIGRYLYVGVSAAYNLAYVYNGAFEGRDFGRPANFSDRLEHEAGFAVTVQNHVDVPSVTLGIGRNFRRSTYFGPAHSFDYPFAFIQLDVVRLAPRFAKVWKKVYRW